MLPLLMCLSPTAYAQKSPPQLLTRVAHCLAITNFLPSMHGRNRSLGFFLDEKSYAPEKVIYVVNFAGPNKSNGWVFTVFLTEHNGHQHFNIQNNATFVLSKREVDGISFVGPGQPLGGTWTQQHIAMAIKQIEKRARFTLNDEDMSVALPSVTCESYAEDARSHF
jgi:hypothetical protein